MSSATTLKEDKYLRMLDRLQAYRNLSIAPANFWQSYLDLLLEQSSADVAIIALSDAQTITGWQVVALSPPTHEAHGLVDSIKAMLPDAALACSRSKPAVLACGHFSLLALELNIGTEKHRSLAVFRFEGASVQISENRLAALKALDDIAANFQLQKFAVDTTLQKDHGAKVLDIVAQMNKHKSFVSTAMAFCNELASHFTCERVSLGWYKKGYLRIVALSHSDSFNKKMEVIQALERAMEESYDQNSEIVYPAQEQSAVIVRDHAGYAISQDCSFLCSIPLRLDNEIVAVCTLERNTTAFSDTELRLLGVATDQVVRRLDELKKNDRWIGALFLDRLREKAAKFFGFEHTWAKIIACTGFIALAVICFIPITYRLDSPVILRTDDITYLSTPFDGHIEDVLVRVGDEVGDSSELLRLDRSDIFLQEAALVAEVNRYQREYEKAMATNELADMLIAQAMRDQSASRLEIVRYKLAQSIVRAPFKGIVIEGDLNEKIGSPVRQGDPLFKVARIDSFYAQLDVRESEIHNVALAMSGQIALASRPQQKFAVEVTRIEPAAVAKKNGNVFIVHAWLKEPPPSWWRPGMTGLSKLNAGKKTILWIVSHRTVDFLRMKLWW